jgi:hypothetical protein
MKKQKLYIKNDKGRYEEYHEPIVEDNALYRKVGNKYIPCQMMDASLGWSEGVYVVLNNGCHITSAKYLEKIFSTYKCSNIEKCSIAKLGGMEELVDYLCKHHDEITGNSLYERCASIVGILFNYEKEK